jgi:hypothetical protein
VITYIKAPAGTASITIQCCDIVRLETHVLGFFDQKLFNLYVFLKKDDSEHFYMLTYPNEESSQQAYDQLSASISEPIDLDHIIQLDDALPNYDAATRVAPL